MAKPEWRELKNMAPAFFVQVYSVLAFVKHLVHSWQTPPFSGFQEDI